MMQLDVVIRYAFDPPEWHETVHRRFGHPRGGTCTDGHCVIRTGFWGPVLDQARKYGEAIDLIRMLP